MRINGEIAGYCFKTSRTNYEYESIHLSDSKLAQKTGPRHQLIASDYRRTLPHFTPIEKDNDKGRQ
jgi:hypothetical protein